MPIYEYECGACDSRFELLLPRRRASGRPKCSACGSRRTRRLMSTFVGRSGSSAGTSSSLGGSDSCTSCTRSSCAGCGSK